MAIDTKPEFNKDQGFVAKPHAIKKVVRAADGTTQVIYVDARTGKQVNPKGYVIIQSDNVVDTTQAKEQKNISQDGSEIATPTNPSGQDALSNTDIVMGRGTDKNSPVSQAVGKQQNYGYIDKPGIMGFAGMLPGPLGLLGMGANLGINANNQKQVAEQREALGFSDQPLSRAVGTVMDTNGYIGDAQITAPGGIKETVPVGFEAQDKYGRTTMTPEEARRHQLATDVKLEEATAEEKKAAIGTFNNQFPQQASVASKMIEAAKGLFGGIFGGTNTGTTPGGAGTGAGFNTPTGGSGGYGSNSFPDAPDAPTNSTLGVDTSRGPQTDTSGYGPGLY